MIDLDQRHLGLAQTIIEKHLTNVGATVYVFVFGSRATLGAKKFSDLDICLQCPDTLTLPSAILSALRLDFEESNFPYFVVIVDYNACDPGFRNIIDQTKVLWLTFQE